jgi:hypothetical protein
MMGFLLGVVIGAVVVGLVATGYVAYLAWQTFKDS